MKLKNLNKEDIWNLVILISVVFLLFTSGYIYSIFEGAKGFCDDMEGSYDFQFQTLNHQCNGANIYRYEDGWNFNRSYYLNNLKIDMT